METVKKIQVIDFSRDDESKHKAPLLCSIVDPKYSYINNKLPPTKKKRIVYKNIKLKRSELLALVPSENYPTVKVIDNEVINYFDLKLSEFDGISENLLDKPVRITLKLT